jgi:hypothetical protein
MRGGSRPPHLTISYLAASFGTWLSLADPLAASGRRNRVDRSGLSTRVQAR